MTVRCGEPGKTLEPIRWANGVQVKSTEVRLTQTSGNEWAITVKEPASVRHYTSCCNYNTQLCTYYTDFEE